MLAPFTAGWQSTDVNPLVIAKSEVLWLKLLPTFQFLSHYFQVLVMTMFLVWFRGPMCMTLTEKSISILSLVYGALLLVFTLPLRILDYINYSVAASRFFSSGYLLGSIVLNDWLYFRPNVLCLPVQTCCTSSSTNLYLYLCVCTHAILVVDELKTT